MSVVDIHDELRQRDFRRVNMFTVEGLGRFHIYMHEGNLHQVIVQEYFCGDGWELWRPVCDENDTQKTLYELAKWVHGDQIPDE